MGDKDEADEIEGIYIAVKEEWEREWREYLIKMVNLITSLFSASELETLCFYLGIEYDNLPGSGHENKARELVRYLTRRGRLHELAEEGQKLRPKGSWDHPPTVMREAWQRVDWQKAAGRYAKWIKWKYDTIRSLGQPAPVPLEGIFTDVYILDTPTAWRRFQIEGLQEQYEAREWPEHRAERRSALEVVQSTPWLFILGKPGAGKTTFLKYIAVQAANGCIPKVPIFVSLKELADSGQFLLDFIVTQFAVSAFPDPQPFVERLLKAGQAIVLFDGLDEVSQADEEQINLITTLTQFTHQYSASQYLITCRIAATDYGFSHFTYVEMADFAPRQVEIFVGKWFANDARKRDLFLAALEKPGSEGLRELARIPLLLTLLCIAFGETLAFPQRRVEIYEEALDALLKKWDASRNIQRDEIYRDLSLGRKRQMFARIASETFEKGTYFIPQRELEKQIVEYLRYIPPGTPPETIDGEAALKAVEAQHGIFIERAARIYSFAHLTFQEYFTAKYIVDSAAQGAVNQLITDHLTDSRWREVFLLTASLLNDASDFFEQFFAALDQVVVMDEQVVSLMTWATQKAAEAGGSAHRLAALRIVYLYPTLAIARADVRIRAQALNYDLARALARVLCLARTIALALARISDLGHASDLSHLLETALAFDGDFARELDRVVVNIRALDKALDQTLGLTHPHARSLVKALARSVITAIQQSVELSQTLGLTELQQGLAELSVPGGRASPATWQAFAQLLRQVVSVRGQVKRKRQFSEVQDKRLEQYMVASKLLVDCLEVAYVDRVGIENRLLLPPRQRVGRIDG